MIDSYSFQVLKVGNLENRYYIVIFLNIFQCLELDLEYIMRNWVVFLEYF